MKHWSYYVREGNEQVFTMLQRLFNRFKDAA